MPTHHATFSIFSTHKTYGAFTVDLARSSARAIRAAAHDLCKRVCSDRGVDDSNIYWTKHDSCLRCGADGADAFGQRDGGELACKCCGAINHAREIPSLPGPTWALLRAGTGVAVAVNVFSGPKDYARSMLGGRLFLLPADGHEVGDHADIDGDGGFIGWWEK